MMWLMWEGQRAVCPLATSHLRSDTCPYSCCPPLAPPSLAQQRALVKVLVHVRLILDVLGAVSELQRAQGLLESEGGRGRRSQLSEVREGGWRWVVFV